MILATHNDLQVDICDFPREAGLQASTEQLAIEIPPETQQDKRRNAPRGQPTRHADVWIEVELRDIVT